MANIIWDAKKMSTGVAEVDAQHQEWIRRYNLFDDAIHEGRGLEIVKSTLDFFLDYADTHFNFEEKVMDERNCPAAEKNLAEHEKMRKILQGYKSYVQKRGVSFSDISGLKVQMEQWLINHMLTVDVQLRDS